MFQFHKNYFYITCILLIIEIVIALFVFDDFVRPYIGDVLVVILLYSFLKSFLKIGIWKCSISVLLFSYLVEILQYFHIVKLMKLENSKILSTLIGNTFSFEDIVAYTIGILLVWFVEFVLLKNEMK